MSEIQVASRYAKSIIDLAQEQDALETVKTNFDQFIQVLKQNDQLRAVLQNPIVGPDKKLAILNQIFSESMHPMILSFFRIVVMKGRSEVLYATAKEFINEYNRRSGIFKAKVISAAPLSEENFSKIVGVVQEATGGKVVLETEVDPALIGGFVLRVGDRQVDTSIATKLQRLKREFAEKTY